MRIFVVGTGRCGSTTFSKAAGHATNYTVGHETYAGRTNPLEYPDQHVEVDPPLIFFAGLLQRRYPDALWVHLIRDKKACVDSLARNDPEMSASFGRMVQHSQIVSPMEGAWLLYESINSMCSMLGGCFRLQLEAAKQQWLACWEFMGCQGDFTKSIEEWNVCYNASRN